MQDADAKPAGDEALSSVSPPPLPDDLAACHTLILEQAQALIAAQAARTQQSQELHDLNAYVKRLLNQLYGRRSERHTSDPNQQMLDFCILPPDALAEAAAEAEKILDEIEVKSYRRKRHTKPGPEKFPAHFPRIEEVIEPPEDVRLCSEHGAKQLIGFDVTETLEFERPKIWVRVTKYAKYVCPQQPLCGVTQAVRPKGLVEGNRYGTSLAAEIIANKYAYHIPLYREQDLFAGLGWAPHRSTLLNVMVSATTLLQPLSQYLKQLALGGGGLGCDDTTLPLIVPPIPPPLDPENPRSARVREVLLEAIEKQKGSVTARMWAYRAFELPINVFDFTVSRHRDGPLEVLRDYEGLLMADGYTGFDAVVLANDTPIARAACWAHARRKWVDIQVNYPSQASVVLAMIRELYDLEDRAKTLSVDERLALRQRLALPILARIRAYLETPAIQEALPKSDLAKAAGYLNNNWETLERYTTDGRFPIDNNETEQLMKQIALGRKNWLFVGSVAGGERAATLMTIVSSAIRNDLDVTAYLKDVLDQRLGGSTDYAAMCPHVWKQTHPESVRTFRTEERRDAADRKRAKRAQRRLQHQA